MKYVVIVERKFNGGSHAFELCFVTKNDANNFITCALQSNDVISAKIK